MGLKTLAALVALAASGYAGWHLSSLKYERLIAQANARSADALAKAAAKSTKVETRTVVEYVDKIRVVHEKAQTIIEKVKEYEPRPNSINNVVGIPYSFGLLYNASLSGDKLPEPASIANETPLDFAATTNATLQNNEACLKNAEQLLSLQKWIEAQKLVHEN